MRNRNTVLKLARSWLGKNERDGSYKEIIDIYNSYSGQLPRNIKMQYNWSWCACTVSALAIKLGYTDIMPIEISCGYLIEKAKQMGIWQENDGYVPKPADEVLYDWDDSGKGDNIGWPDHVGLVDAVYENAGYFVVLEGNYSDSVKRRTISINGKYIRGFITPKYDDDITYAEAIPENKDLTTVAREVISGQWGSGDERKNKLTAAGYNAAEVQKIVNILLNNQEVAKPSTAEQDQKQPVEKYVVATCAAKKLDVLIGGTYETTTDLYCRNDAGSNKKALCKIPKGTKVHNFGYYNLFDNVKWLYIAVILDGVQYTGFSSSNYLKKV